MNIMKRFIGSIVLIAFVVSASAQDRGIGLRAGEPSGISFKKYLPRNKAIELGLGTTTFGWNGNYYRNAFRDFDRYEGYDYHSHQVRNTIYLQAKYLLQNNIQIEGMMGKLDWYWGIGGLLKMAQIDYRFRDNTTTNNGLDTRTDIDLGPEGIIGMEYTFEDVPLTIFGDISLMIEFADRPGTFRGLSGVGVRYNF